MKAVVAVAAAFALMSGLAVAQTAAPAVKAPATTAAKPAAAKPAAAKPKTAAKPAPVEAAAAEPPAPVILEPLANSLQAYASFQQDIDLVNGGSIQNPRDIERALDKAAAMNRDQLTRGYIAYGAMTAARSEKFVAEVRKVAAAYGKERVMKALVNNYRYAGTIDGGSEAAEFVARVAASDSQRVVSAGEKVKTRAREAQNLAWGKALAGPAAPRTTRLKTAAASAKGGTVTAEVTERLKIVPGSGSPLTDPVSFGGDNFWTMLNGKAPPEATLTSLPVQAKALTFTSESGGSAIRGAMLSLAAMYALDATMDDAQTTNTLLNNNLTNGCLQRAQLQFYQCVASARFNYENMACVGEAGLITVGGCFGDASK